MRWPAYWRWLRSTYWWMRSDGHAEVREVERCGAEPLVGHWGLLAQLRRCPAADPQEARAEPLRAFPSRFLRIVCDRCGKERMISETLAR
jgi:hypothetical protein